MQLQLQYTNYTTPQLNIPLHYNYNYSCTTPHYIQQLWVRWTTRWPLQPLQPLQKTQLQPPFGPSVDSLCHPWFTTTNLSYRFPIFETSATALCGTTGKDQHWNRLEAPKSKLEVHIPAKFWLILMFFSSHVSRLSSERSPPQRRPNALRGEMPSAEAETPEFGAAQFADLRSTGGAGPTFRKWFMPPSFSMEYSHVFYGWIIGVMDYKPQILSGMYIQADPLAQESALDSWGYANIRHNKALTSWDALKYVLEWIPILHR